MASDQFISESVSGKLDGITLIREVGGEGRERKDPHIWTVARHFRQAPELTLVHAHSWTTLFSCRT